MPLQRRNEYIAGRKLAAKGLARFGIYGCEISRSRDGSPVWPEGVCGSISHKRNLCVVILAHNSPYRALGVDVEKHQSLTPEVWKYFVHPNERVQGVDEPFDRIADLLFSCKEAAYKCLQPAFTTRISFQDIEVRLRASKSDVFEVKAMFQAIELEGELYRWKDVILVWIGLKKTFDFRTYIAYCVRKSYTGVSCMANITLDDFLARVDEWRDFFMNELDDILEGEEGFEADEDDTLWGQVPAVNSKSVVQLNPVVEKRFEIKLKPEQWIKPGGFDSIGEAVEAMLAAIKAELTVSTGEQ